MSFSASSPALQNLFSDLEARVSAHVRTAERVQSEHLNQSMRRLRQAAGFAEIAAILCDASAPFCNDCTVFHVDHDVVTGACRRGMEHHNDLRFSEVRFPKKEAAAFAAVIESREPVVTICSAAEISPMLLEVWGTAADDKVHLFPLIVDGTTTGVLCAAGAVGSPALELLTQSAGVALEARRRPVHAAAPDVLRIDPAPSAPNSSSPGDRRLDLRAQRFARVQVAEMLLYQSEAVQAGRARGDLYSALEKPIDHARQAYRQMFLSATPTMADYFHQELLRVLANHDAARLGEKYPGPLV